MGHYASEMMCDRCRQCRCSCPAKPDATLNQWVVDNDYSVLQAKDFDVKHGFLPVPGGKLRDIAAGRMRRIGRKHFDTKEQAQQHALEQLDTRIAASETHTAELRKRRQDLQAP